MLFVPNTLFERFINMCAYLRLDFSLEALKLQIKHC